MHVFITGSSGFVGRRLAHTLRAHGAQVEGVDFRALPGDPSLPIDLRELRAADLRPFDVCVHLASDVGGFLHNAADRGQVEYELELIRAVAELCRVKHCRRVIYASSIAVFERAKAFTRGTLTTNAQRSHYARAKAQGEKLVESLFEEFTIVRPTNIFGAAATCVDTTAGESHVIPELLRKIRANPTLEVLGDGRQMRNFVHVDDVVRFVMTVVQRPTRGWYNLRSDIQLSIAELAQELLEVTGQQRDIVFQPEYLRYEPQPIYPFDMAETLALGWQPMVNSLRDGLAL